MYYSSWHQYGCFDELCWSLSLSFERVRARSWKVNITPFRIPRENVRRAAVVSWRLAVWSNRCLSRIQFPFT